MSCTSLEKVSPARKLRNCADVFLGFVQERTVEWETVTSLLPVPEDTGSVFVIDGGQYFFLLCLPPQLTSRR